MNASAFLIVLIQTTLCLTVGLIICAIARNFSGVRLLVSQIAIVASAVLLLAGSLFTLQVHPIVAVNLPEAVAFTVPNTRNEVEPTNQVQATLKETATTEFAKTEVQPQPKSEPVYQSVSSFTISKLVSMTYGAGFILSLLPMALGALWIQKIRKGCRQVTEGTTFDVVKRVSERHRIRAPKLNASEAITIPFVSGLFRKLIFVPIKWVDGQCDIACGAIIEHEIAHVVSRDLERKFLCRVACSLVWFQPLAWMTFRVMGNASEELCDQSVLQAGVPSIAYADTLLRIRENAKRSNVPGLVIGAVSRESNLAKRMKLILATDVSRVKKVSRLVAGMAVCTLVVLAATSTFVFGHSSKKEQSSIVQGPYSGLIKLMDSAGKPISGAKVSLIVRAKDETERLIPLTVNNDSVEISDEVVKDSVIGTLLIETASGNIDFKRLWPAEHKITEFRLAKPFTIQGKIGFPGSLNGPVNLSVRMLVRKVDKEAHNFEFAYLEKLQHDFKSIQTDLDGNFELSGMPSGAEIALGVNDDRFSFDSMLLRAKPDDQGNYKPLNYTLRLASSVSGVVTRKGKPVVGMMIAAQGQKDSGWGEAITDAQGKYTIKQLSPEIYNIAAKLSDEEQSEFTVRAHEGVVVKEGEAKQETDFEVIPGGIISGTLTDATGKPIPNGEIGIYGPAHPHTTAWVQGTKADATGKFRTRVPSGLNEVYYMGETETHIEMVKVQVKDGMESKVQVIGPYGKEDLPTVVVRARREPSDFPPIQMVNGTILDITCLCKNEGSGILMWLPDGSPLNKSDKLYYDVLGKLDGSLAKSTSTRLIHHLNPGATYAFVNCSQLPSEDDVFRFKSTSLSGIGSYHGYMKRIELLVPIGAKFPRQGDVGIAIPTGLPKTYYRGKLNAKYRVEKVKGGRSLVFDIPKDMAEKDLTMRGISSDGRNATMIGGGFGTIQNRIGISPGNKITSVEISFRDLEWATFKGVHFQPNSR